MESPLVRVFEGFTSNEFVDSEFLHSLDPKEPVGILDNTFSNAATRAVVGYIGSKTGTGLIRRLFTDRVQIVLDARCSRSCVQD